MKKARSPSIAKGRAEDIADEDRVTGPVHAELELLDDPRHDADGEVDQEELAEEPRHSVVVLVVRAVRRRLETGDEESETNGQRNEEEVENRRHAELPTRQGQCRDARINGHGQKIQKHVFAKDS